MLELPSFNFLKGEYPGQIDMKEVADLAKKNLKSREKEYLLKNY